MYMLNNRIKVITILVVMLLTLISCARREDMPLNDNITNQVIKETPDSLNLEKDNQLEPSTNNSNQEKDNQIDQSIKVSLKSISQKEYDKWVVQMYDGELNPNGQPLQC
ncbi:MAG TPA: hypothetical protein VHQ24_04120 [Lachnospiraceae bacterium]|nr:hypothetical protein [Lachnospiraceae bacterium]